MSNILASNKKSPEAAQTQLEIQHLRTRIAAGEIAAVALDTSIFERHGIQFQSGLLAQCDQFRHGPTKLVIPDVVKKETIKHLASKIKESRLKLETAIKAAAKYMPSVKINGADWKQAMEGEADPEEQANALFCEFQKITNLEVINSEDYVGIDQIMNAYFGRLPPFPETGSKKHEFPDAISLLALNGWADTNETSVLVVSNDGDWLNFCQTKSRLVAVSDLSIALSMFQLGSADEICDFLNERYKNGGLDDLSELIAIAIRDELESVEFSPEARSSFRYEYDYHLAELQSFQLNALSATGCLFRPINQDNNSIVVEALANAEVSIDFHFSFFTYDSVDRDEVSLGSGRATVDMPISFKIIASLGGNITNAGGAIDAEDAEATVLSKLVIDCGEIEPEWLSMER